MMYPQILFVIILPLSYFIFPGVIPAGADNFQQVSQDQVFQREHSLYKPYQSSGMTIPNWEFFGSTIVSSNYVRLTPDFQSKQGGIWNAEPYQTRYWQVEIAFNVHGHGSELYGDGFAIWYTRDPPKGGPVFGNKDFFTGLGVILDTYANQNNVNSYAHPKISIMVNNGSLHYDHENDGVNTELASCECKFRGLEHDARILLQYFNDQLMIKTDIDNSGIWRDCATLNNVYLPTHYFFGVTAATGDLSDNHDIQSIRMTQLSPIVQASHTTGEDLPRADFLHTNRDRLNEAQSGMSALRKLFIVVCVIAGVVAVSGFGYFLYVSKRNSARKRFY